MVIIILYCENRQWSPKTENIIDQVHGLCQENNELLFYHELTQEKMRFSFDWPQLLSYPRSTMLKNWIRLFYNRGNLISREKDF